jgi:hypothetical protein
VTVLENDLLVPIFQIALGLALILGFFTVVSSVLAGFLIISGPIFQFIAILSSASQVGGGSEPLAIQTLVATGSMNLLLLVTAVLWLTPSEGTPWSLDAVIFAHRRPRPERSGAPGGTSTRDPVPAPAPSAPAAPATAPQPHDEPAVLSASRGE